MNPKQDVCRNKSVGEPVSRRRFDSFQQLSLSAVLRDCSTHLRDAFQCMAQRDTTLHDCMLYLTQHLHASGISRGTPNQCASLGDVLGG